MIARNSTFTYKGQAIDVKRVGRELGVRYVPEGSVRNGYPVGFWKKVIELAADLGSEAVLIVPLDPIGDDLSTWTIPALHCVIGLVKQSWQAA